MDARKMSCGLLHNEPGGCMGTMDKLRLFDVY